MSAARWLSHSLFGTLCAAALVFCLHVCAGALSLVGQPFLGFTLTEEGFVNPVSLHVWGADQVGLKRWDLVVAVNGELVFSAPDVTRRALSYEIGSDVVYQVKDLDGRLRFVPVPTRMFTASDLVKSHASLAFLGLIFVGVAMLLYFLRPATAEAWAFFAFFASIGVCMASVVDMTWLWRWPALYPLLAPFLCVFGMVLVGVITRAYARPFGSADREGRWLARVWWGITAVAFVVGLALALGLYHTAGDMGRYLLIDNLMYGVLAVGTITGLTALVVAYRRGKSAHQRARLRQILWAWPVGAGIPTLNLFFGHVLELFGMSLLWNGFILLVPLSTADAIVRHDLLRLTDSARRFVGGMTVAAIVGMALGFVMWAAVQFLKLTDAAGMVALAALLFAVAAPLTHRVQRYVDDLLRSAPYDAGRLLAQFTARASTAKRLTELTDLLRDVLENSVQPATVRLYRLERGERRLLPVLGATAALDLDDASAAVLGSSEVALYDDEDRPPPGLEDATLALRLAVAGEPVGLLVLSARSDGRPYEGGDAAFVASLAGPLAAALVNTRAYAEIQALNQELEARVEARTRELALKNEELALLNQRKDELVATVSHDFRSPLAIIRQNVQTLLRDLKHMDPEDLRYFLEGVARQEDRLTAMCEKLLDLARLKQIEAPSDEVDLEQLVRQLVDGFLPRARDASVALSVVVAEGAPVRVRGDKERLGQVLQNLVDNALKFTPEGGNVSVRLVRGERPGTLVIEVSDTGHGVPPDALGRLFEPFFQVPSNKHAGQGSGLGLAIVKAVVEAHGGQIDVESEEGEGTTFRVTLAALTTTADAAA